MHAGGTGVRVRSVLAIAWAGVGLGIVGRALVATPDPFEGFVVVPLALFAVAALAALTDALVQRLWAVPPATPVVPRSTVSRRAPRRRRERAEDSVAA